MNKVAFENAGGIEEGFAGTKVFLIYSRGVAAKTPRRKGKGRSYQRTGSKASTSQ